MAENLGIHVAQMGQTPAREVSVKSLGHGFAIKFDIELLQYLSNENGKRS